MKLGDAVEFGIKKTGLDKLAPEDCGCQQRKEKLIFQTSPRCGI